MTLYLVRHGLPVVDPATPAAEWPLDPRSYGDVWALRESGRLPGRAHWYSSPETKAKETAQLLFDGPVGILDGLREHQRTWGDGDFAAQIERAFARPDVPAHDGWETIDACAARLLATVSPVLAAHEGEDVVLVGHGTAWTLTVSRITSQPPDLRRWRELTFPDLFIIRGLGVHMPGKAKCDP